MLKSIFTWWNGATIGIRFTVARRGVFIGEDDYGNRYYEARGHPRQLRRPQAPLGDLQAATPTPRRCRPSGTAGCTTPSTSRRPSDPLTRQAWEQDHLPNLTGTIWAWRPKGAISRGGERAKATGDYEAWRPE